MFKNKFYSYVGGSNADLSFSVESYYEISEVLIDQYLSREMLMNFKNCSQVMNDVVVTAPFLFLPVSSFLTYKLFGGIKRMGSNKVAIPFFLSVHILCLWRVYTMPIQNKLFTKIVADPTIDGQYIRTQLSTMKPGLWKMMSRELYNKGYRFPEMLEYKKTTQFPTGFVEPY